MRKLTIDDLLSRTIPVTESGCWIWEGRLSPDGYAQTELMNGNRRVHRILYEVYRGPIPQGLTLDHLCRVRCCVNPGHLEIVSRGENTLRGFAPPAVNARKTHCRMGHEFTLENTSLRKDGSRNCKVCNLAISRRWKQKRRLELRAVSQSPTKGARDE